MLTHVILNGSLWLINTRETREGYKGEVGVKLGLEKGRAVGVRRGTGGLRYRNNRSGGSRTWLRR